MDWMALVSRWAHVGSVILLVGGSAFLLLVLAPAADKLGAAEHDSLRKNLIDRWRKFVHPLVALILISGLYNFYARMNTERPWHMLAGIKLLLGLFILFIASTLVGRSKGLQKIRDDWRFWLKINLIVAALAVLLSGYMRFLQPKPTTEKPAVTQQA
jgi:uncharacterized membrane protein